MGASAIEPPFFGSGGTMFSTARVYVPKSQDNCGSGGMLLKEISQRPELTWLLTPHGYRQTSCYCDLIRTRSDAYGRIS
jgi:hypothetical protein